MNDLTRRVLSECKKAGYKRICVECADSAVPISVSFPFGPKGSIFALPNRRSGDGWPAIWKIIENLEIWEGCGNGQQVAVKSGVLDQGYYYLVNGKWKCRDGNAKNENSIDLKNIFC